jgi:transposase-like protein
MKELPKEQREQTRKLMRAAFRAPTAEEGEKRLEQVARQLEHDHFSAARNLREVMKEMFTLQRLTIPTSLHKCLATTNLIESPHSGVRKRTHNVCRWRDADMVERWVASAWLLTRSTSAVSMGMNTSGLSPTSWNVKSHPRSKNVA